LRERERERVGVSRFGFVCFREEFCVVGNVRDIVDSRFEVCFCLVLGEVEGCGIRNATRNGCLRISWVGKTRPGIVPAGI